MKYMYALLLLVPVAIVADLLHMSPVIVFATSALGIIPLAALLGEATEVLAQHTGPRLGGLINATLGNAAELIITIFAIRAGLLELVKASITGSILGNVLLVMGSSILLGGLRFGTQTFSRRTASTNATIMTLGVVLLAIPAVFFHSLQNGDHAVQSLSFGVAAVMIGLYALYLIYSLRFEEKLSGGQNHGAAPAWSVRSSVALLLISTLLTAWLSEILAGAVEPVVTQLGVTEFFLGVILIPLVGNVAEHVVAIEVALKDQMDLSLAISLGSSLQIAMFVAPLLVFVSVLVGPETLSLVFNRFELAALGGAAFIATLVSQDGESNWLEGAELLAVYLVLSMAFFFLPT
jgi:Ca2+:H+ antiporter